MKKKRTSQPKQSGQQASLHDSFFKNIFKKPKYIKELTQVIFPPEVLTHSRLDDIVVQDKEFITISGRQLRADLVASLPLRGDASGVNITISLIFEHKSYKDPDAIIQIMEYYVELCREQRKQSDKGKGKNNQRDIIIPIVLLCCKDKDYHPPSDYLAWVFGDEDVPKAAKAFAPWVPKLFGNVVNFRQLPADKVWTVADSLGIIVHGMSELWDANDDTLALIIEKAQLLSRAEAEYLLTMLRDYYGDADNTIERQDFDRVERERWPNLQEEERFMPTIDFGFDRAKRLGIEEGIEKERQEAATRMLARGMPDEQIQDVLQITAKELNNIKRQLKN